MFFAYKKLLGQTETRTHDRMYCQTIRTVSDISRDDQARIVTCSLLTPTDRQPDRLKENYSVDIKLHSIFHIEYLYPSVIYCVSYSDKC